MNAKRINIQIATFKFFLISNIPIIQSMAVIETIARKCELGVFVLIPSMAGKRTIARVT